MDRILSLLLPAILLKQQSLRVAAPSPADQFSHHFSLLSSRSDSQRRDSLAYLTTYVSTRSVGSPLPFPTSVLLPKLCPLVLDSNRNVRSQLLKLLKTLPSQDIGDHVNQVLPYIRAAMTHLAADIRLSANEILLWLLDAAGEDVVSCAGGFVKTMKAFLAMLGWHSKRPHEGTERTSSFNTTSIDGRPVAVSLEVLGKFLEIGVGEELPNEDPHLLRESSTNNTFVNYEQHRLPTKSNGFGYLNLFGIHRDAETEMLEDRDERQKVFNDQFREAVVGGLEIARQAGGEVGRASAVVMKMLPPVDANE